MVLEIVWRNPLPPTNAESQVKRITSDDCHAVYEVSNHEAKERFELILGGRHRMNLAAKVGTR